MGRAAVRSVAFTVPAMQFEHFGCQSAPLLRKRDCDVDFGALKLTQLDPNDRAGLELPVLVFWIVAGRCDQSRRAGPEELGRRCSEYERSLPEQPNVHARGLST